MRVPRSSSGRTPRGESGLWTALAVVAVIALPAAYLALPGHVVHGDLGTKADVAKARNDARGSAIQLVAAMVVAVGLVLTARTYLLARQGQLTERFAKAAEQLGHAGDPVRLGGIYALGRLAADGDALMADHVREVLAAYVRARAPVTSGAARPAGEPPPADVQAALSVLGGLPRAKDPTKRRIDLRATDLRSADLHGARLPGVRLARAKLEWATLNDADLRGAQLPRAFADSADFTSASLEGAQFLATKLRGAILKDALREGGLQPSGPDR
jgi:hypothetical protein